MRQPTTNSNKFNLFGYFLVMLSGLFLLGALLLTSSGSLTGNVKNVFTGKSNFTPTGYSGAVKNSGPIQLKMKLDNDYYYRNSEKREMYVYLDLESANIDHEAEERSPMNISLVIDKSGSMNDKKKLDYVKESVNYVIDELDMRDYVSIVTYDDYVDVLQSSSNVRQKHVLRDKVSGITAGGYTNLSGGMLEGYDQVKNSYTRGYVNRVLLLSDGLANKGITDIYELKEIVKEKNWRDGIIISTFGVGNDFNEDLMSNIADYGRGNYYFINSPNRIPELFAQELKGIRALAGQNTKVTLRFPSEYLSLNKVFGFPYEVEGDEITIDFKDVFSKEKKSVLLKFDIDRPITESVNFHAELMYDDVTSDFRRVRDNQFSTIHLTNNRLSYEDNFDEEVQQNVATFEATAIMEEALREADNGNYDVAKRKIEEGKGYLDEQMQNVAPNTGMTTQYKNMQSYGDELNGAEEKTEDERKVMQKSAKYDNYKVEKKKYDNEDDEDD